MANNPKQKLAEKMSRYKPIQNGGPRLYSRNKKKRITGKTFNKKAGRAGVYAPGSDLWWGA